MLEVARALCWPHAQSVRFALKTVLGAGLALWLAMRWELEQPTWALMTAIIVAQPQSGMAVQKGAARLLGTVVGSAMSVVLMSYASQAPWLFIGSIAVWIGLCTAASASLRSAFSYGFVLAGYTVAVIALPALSQPLHIFDQAAARCTEISLGIVSATLISALLWPSRVSDALLSQADNTLDESFRAVDAYIQLDDETRPALTLSLSKIMNMDAQREHAWFEGQVGRNRGDAIGELMFCLLSMLRHGRSTARQTQQLNPAQVQALAQPLADVRRALASRRSTELVAVRTRLEGCAVENIDQVAVYGWLRRAIRIIDEAISSVQALEIAKSGLTNAYTPAGFAIHRDVLSAALFGMRSSFAFLAMACLWLATAWPSAAGGMLLTCVVCGLFASSEQGAAIGMKFLKGIAVAIPTALIVSQFILPQLSSFAMLAMAVGVPLFFGSLAVANPRTGAAGLAFCLHFVILMSISNHMVYGVDAFLNSAMAITIGVSAAVLAFKIFVFRYPARRIESLRQSLRTDLQSLARLPLAGVDEWFSGRMAHGLLTYSDMLDRLSSSQKRLFEADKHGFDLGDELLLLRHHLVFLDREATYRAEAFVQAIIRALDEAPSSANATMLASSADALIRVLGETACDLHGVAVTSSVIQIQSIWRLWCDRQEP